MKPVKTFEGRIEGALAGKEIEMQLDDSAEGRAHLMSLMTDLYSDPEMAIIREYSTNALDSHIEARNSAPIEVTTPNALSPYLTIRDFGIGLTVSDLEKVYSKYGASTKRGSDEVNGLLGLGGKSALTYTNQFTVTAIKGGVKSQIAVTRLDTGAGVMEVVDTRATDEPNGVEIKIPVKSRNSIESKVHDFFYFWQPGTVLVDGVEPTLLVNETDVTKINENTYVLSTRHLRGGRRMGRDDSTDLIVMGNVAYATKGKPFTEQVAESTYYNVTVVYVPMGTVAFAPSREAIMYGPRTVHAIESIVEAIKSGLVDSIKNDLASAKSHADAFRTWLGWAGVVGPNNVPVSDYKGTKFERIVRARHYFLTIEGGRHNWSAGTRADSGGSSDVVDLSRLLDENVLIITGYDRTDSPKGPWKRRVKQYIETLPNAEKIKDILCFSTMPAAPWTDGVGSVDWHTQIAPLKLINAAGATGGRTGTIPIKMRDSGGPWIDTTTVDPNRACWYMSPTDEGDLQYKINQAVEITPDAQVVMLGRNRWDKFRRENPHAKEFIRYWSADYENDVKARMTEDDLFYADHDDAYRNEAKHLKSVNDPTFARLAGIKVDSNLITAYNRIKSATKQLNTAYPLIGHRYYGDDAGKNVAHKIAYINAVYTTKGK
jgi:hypothetical protein